MICGLDNNSDIISVLKKTLINAGIKFGRGIAVLVEIFLKIAMLKPCREQVPLQSGQLRVRLFLFTLYVMLICV